MLKRSRRRKVMLIALAWLTVILGLIGTELQRIVYQPIPINPDESLIIRVQKSTTAQSLIRSMHAQGWVGSVKLWTYLIRFKGWSGKLRSGIYQIQTGESAYQLLQRIVSGDILHKSFMIKPGSIISQISHDLERAPFLDYKPSDWSSIATEHRIPEGLLLAETYTYDAGSSAQILLNRAHQQLIRVLSLAWQSNHQSLPYNSPYELLIAASILEKEAALPAERRLIAGVIINRLKSHMLLQMDPTVIYALGNGFTGKLSHEQMNIDSPYNTYRYQGLPPTPIAMVSKDAIDAAAHPTPTSYLYFVAKGDGTHEFHTKYSDHLQAIKHYMRK